MLHRLEISLSAGSTGIVTCQGDLCRAARSRILQVLYDELRARVGLWVGIFLDKVVHLLRHIG